MFELTFTALGKKPHVIVATPGRLFGWFASLLSLYGKLIRYRSYQQHKGFLTEEPKEFSPR